MTYLLILTLIIAGERTEYVVDYGLTAQECAQAVRENPQSVIYCEADTGDKPQADEKPAALGA